MISQSVVSYAPQLGPIKSLAVCKRTHGVACAFDRTNAIHVMRVDVMARNQEGPDFTCMTDDWLNRLSKESNCRIWNWFFGSIRISLIGVCHVLSQVLTLGALVKTIDSSHGSIISLQHATVGPAQSLLLYSTTDGIPASLDRWLLEKLALSFAVVDTNNFRD